MITSQPVRTVILVFFIWARCSSGLSLLDGDRKPSLFRRRDLLWKVPIGATVACGYGKLACTALSFQGGIYPAAHEDRVRGVIASAFESGFDPSVLPRSFRTLEVGVGHDWRVLRRELYNTGCSHLAEKGIKTIDIVGMDILSLNNKYLQEASQSRPTSPTVETSFFQGDLTSGLAYPDGFFDSVLCFLTLCSVEDQNAAISELKRLVRPSGGTLGFVEHVAVNPDEKSRSFLEIQQKLLDPVQQVFADNCHLHRYTQDALYSAFKVTDLTSIAASSARILHSERFYVDGMWPVSCQCSGVIQRIEY